MASSSSYARSGQRGTRVHRPGRLSNALPFYASSSSAVQEKLAESGQAGQVSPWVFGVPISLPFVAKGTRIYFFNPQRLYHFSRVRLGRKRTAVLFCFAVCFILLFLLSTGRRIKNNTSKWIKPFIRRKSTLVYKREDIQRIWQWEVSSGHFPSRAQIPEAVRLSTPPNNPALPPRRVPVPASRNGYSVHTEGTGMQRVYLDVKAPVNSGFPPRPVPGSVADLDIVMEHCDFSTGKYVRDCLEVLRTGAGLDHGHRLRRGKLDDWKYIYVERDANWTTHEARSFDEEDEEDVRVNDTASGTNPEDEDDGLLLRTDVEIEVPPIPLPKPLEHIPSSIDPETCDPDHPRIFHSFWTGPFTDKPYLALLSFLFTQNLGLNSHSSPSACRPRFWVWINPGPAATVPDAQAESDMYARLQSNPWSAPFLHERFKGVIEFKLWNTTEQLDNIAELDDEWRSRNLFNSRGMVYDVDKSKAKRSETGSTPSETDLFSRTGSTSSATYDRLSVILSDLARFIVCHQYGGIYLDADTIFLRDWEELWNWKGAFSYRWSRLKDYNTAVLRLNKHSALGTFLFRTAVKNNMDFHPQIITRYVKDAHIDSLLLRLPDAMFDPAWLNTEHFQRDRPPQPFFTDFDHFFDTPTDSIPPNAVHFEGFFRGAFSYHWHNNWWKPCDTSRNWPDLGPRFIEGERSARKALWQRRRDLNATTLPYVDDLDEGVDADRRDLDWVTVMKRTFEAYIRGDRPNAYGEMLEW